MSYTLIKKIAFKDDGVYITSASSNVYPRSYHEFRADYYSNLFKEQGFLPVVREFAEEMKHGEVKFLRGCKFNNAMLQAKAELETSSPEGLGRFLNAETYAKYVVMRVDDIYSSRPTVNRTSELTALQAMRRDPEAVLAMCKGNVEAFWYADPSVQNDVETCKRYVKDFAGQLLFRIPEAVRDDKETALYAVSQCGCRFRDLSERLQDDPEVVLSAFGSEKFPEHLPDLISARLQNDVALMKQVIEVEPKLHFGRSKIMCNNPEIVLELAKKAVWVNDFAVFPEHLRNAPAIQRAMASRLHDDIPEDQREKRLEVLSRFVKPEYLVAEQLKDAVALEYKGIVFDDWAIDATGEGNGIWGEMCEHCADKYKDLLVDELDDAGAMGACSVKGCSVVGADADTAKHYYVDFKPELIVPLTWEQLLARENAGSLDGKIAHAQQQAAHADNNQNLGAITRDEPVEGR